MHLMQLAVKAPLKFAEMKRMFTGQIHFSLSLALQCELSRFRRCLWDVSGKMLVFMNSERFEHLIV